MKILLIEDEHKIATSLQQGLQQEHYVVDVAFDGKIGYDLAIAEQYDLIILDRLLPEMDGITICEDLRTQQNHTPILMLTAKAQLKDRVEGLNSGADDYLTKPFAFEELLARIKALTRRPKDMSQTTLKIADLTLNKDTFRVIRADKEITLSAKEFAMLEYLMRHANTVVSKEKIISHVWNYDADILPNTVEVFMGYLRTKIDKAFSDQPSLIHTVRGFGYTLGEKR